MPHNGYRALFSDLEGVFTPGPHSHNANESYWAAATRLIGQYDYMQQQVSLFHVGQINLDRLYANVAQRFFDAIASAVITAEDLEKVARYVPHEEGTRDFISRAVHKFGRRVVIVSGGADFLVDYFAREYDIPYKICNALSKHLVEGIPDECEVNSTNKLFHAENIAAQIQVPLEESIGMADGPEDCNWLAKVKLPIATNAVPELEELARQKDGIVIRGTQLNDYRERKVRRITINSKKDIADYIF